jgi:hypothetical protein
MPTNPMTTVLQHLRGTVSCPGVERIDVQRRAFVGVRDSLSCLAWSPDGKFGSLAASPTNGVGIPA